MYQAQSMCAKAIIILASFFFFLNKLEHVNLNFRKLYLTDEGDLSLYESDHVIMYCE